MAGDKTLRDDDKNTVFKSRVINRVPGTLEITFKSLYLTSFDKCSKKESYLFGRLTKTINTIVPDVTFDLFLRFLIC